MMPTEFTGKRSFHVRWSPSLTAQGVTGEEQRHCALARSGWPGIAAIPVIGRETEKSVLGVE